MARRNRKKSRRSSKMTLPIAVLAPVAMAGLQAWEKRSNPTEMQYIFTGIGADGQFHADQIMRTYMPMAAGLVIHKMAGRFGLNSAMGRAKVPLLRL